MGAVLLVCRPLAILAQNLTTQQAIVPSVTSLIRWQSHWHVVRQGLPFFQEDFAGRIANRVMQSARPAGERGPVRQRRLVHPGLRHGGDDPPRPTDARLAIPILVWFVLYATLLRIIVPRMRDRARKASRGAQPAHRPGGGQLHQHHDGEAVRPRRAGGRPCAGGAGAAEP
jgi:ATP-binding cassette subfamily B multidrug efflux pump